MALPAVTPTAEPTLSLALLAGGIAHDFNNLLTGILGNAAVALQELPGGPTRDAVADIQLASTRARELVSQVLAFAGRAPLQPKSVCLGRLVRETAKLLGPDMPPIRVATETNALPVLADPAQLRQVVMNLVTNAVDALGGAPGEIAVTVSQAEVGRTELEATVLGQGLLAGPYARLDVRDTGCGMDAATCARMFDPYFTTKSTGRGLGLAALLGIVRRHGGTLAVTSAPGEGTMVTVWLPLLDDVTLRDHSEVGVQQRPIRKRTGNILIVEDEEMVRRVAARMFGRMGFDVTTARGGQEALDILTADHNMTYSAVFIDVEMPEMDGRTFLGHLRRLRPDVPAVLMSGFAAAKVAHPPDAWLNKPFSIQELAGLLDRLLGPVSPGPEQIRRRETGARAALERETRDRAPERESHAGAVDRQLQA